MIGSHSYRLRKLEIMQKITFFEEQKRIYPHIRKEAQLNIEVLSDMLDDLECQYSQQTNNRC